MNKWFPYGVGSDSAMLRIYCFPFAGGAASAFRSWVDALGPEVAVVPVQLPGRETRLDERPLSTVDEIVDSFGRSCCECVAQRPFAFLGHSFGAKVAYECSMRFQSAGRLPSLLVLAACNPVHIFDRSPRVSTLDDASVIENLARLKGTPSEALNDLELMSLVMPYLRADYCASETYEYRARGRLRTRVVVFGGDEDPDVSRSELDQWKHHSDREFSMEMLPGDHFFMFRNDREMLRALRNACAPSLPWATGGPSLCNHSGHSGCEHRQRSAPSTA